MNSLHIPQDPHSEVEIIPRKKAELDALSYQVLNAEYVVEQQTAAVASLTEKLKKFDIQLIVANDNRASASTNKELVDEVVQNAKDLVTNADISLEKMATAHTKINPLATQMSSLIKELIYSVEVINKLAVIVTRKKALVPLISDELITLLAQAGKDASTAVELTLTALKSTFASHANNKEAVGAVSLTALECTELYKALTGAPLSGVEKNHNLPNSIQAILHQAYDIAKAQYDHAETAKNATIEQLNAATSALEKAQIELQSLESGLAAATAAALAS